MFKCRNNCRELTREVPELGSPIRKYSANWRLTEHYKNGTSLQLEPVFMNVNLLMKP